MRIKGKGEKDQWQINIENPLLIEFVPLPLLGEDVDLVLEVSNRLLVLLAKHLCGLLRLHVDIFEKFSELG